MNELQPIGRSDSGEKLLFYPHDGHLFYFEKIEWDEIRLCTVDTVFDVEQEYNEWTTFENLPAPVRRAIITSHYGMRSTKSTLTGVMAGD